LLVFVLEVAEIGVFRETGGKTNSVLITRI